MRKGKLLLTMLALFALLAAGVVLGSPYASVMAPAPQDIEEIWAIEDTREESDAPLVTALANHGVPLAYNAETNTFYCTLGLENMDTWPEMHLTAPGAPGVKLMFVDDYTHETVLRFLMTATLS